MSAILFPHEEFKKMTTEKHEGLPVHGYKPQSPEAVALVNGFKEDEERLLRKLDALKDSGVPFGLHPGTGEPMRRAADGRWLAIARTQLEQGFMALNRSVFQPGWVRLPEDDNEKETS